MNTPMVGGNGGGGGGGGNAFADVVLTPQPNLPTPTPVSYPVAVGDRVEGITGMLYVLLVRQADDSLEPMYTLWTDNGTNLPEGLAIELKGAVDGLDTFHYLPLRIWGQVTAMTNQGLEVEVERYEEIYEGVRLHSWIGTEEVVTVDNQEFVLFTTTEGQQYALMNSTPSQLVGNPGDLLIIDGYSPTGNTFAGYPTIEDLSTGVASAESDLGTHVNVMATPGVGLRPDVDTQSNMAYPVNADDIELVELAYLASDFTHGWPPPPADCICRIVQPVWRFAGRTADGEVFSVMVQALTDEYLKPAQ
jgi:hypothetical protein